MILLILIILNFPLKINSALKVFVDSRTCGASGGTWTKRDASKNMVPKSTNETQEAIAKA